MAQAARDENFVPTLIGVDEATLTTPTLVGVTALGEVLTKLSSDIELGAVEIKDGDSDTRLDVETDGTKNAAFIQANLLPLPTGAATSAKQLADGHNVTVDNTSGSPVPTDEIEPTGVNGGPVTVGTSQVELTFTGTTQSIMIQSDPDNTGRIWFGLTGISNSGGSAFAQLEPGDAVSMDLNDAAAALFAISDTASQTVHKMALT